MRGEYPCYVAVVLSIALLMQNEELFNALLTAISCLEKESTVLPT